MEVSDIILIEVNEPKCISMFHGLCVVVATPLLDVFRCYILKEEAAKGTYHCLYHVQFYVQV